MSSESNLLQCYNRGCGQKFDPTKNSEESCHHHPGSPFFHDAYKGWSCCNKKCTDFTEFLNIKGCTVSKHSNLKPPEPEKPVVQPGLNSEVIEVKPIEKPTIKRPPLDVPMQTLVPTIAPSLTQQLTSPAAIETVVGSSGDNGEITVGTTCKNSGCTVSYEGPHTNETVCVYHPGSPVFHEGIKYWSCCQRKTTDFNAFLNQAGCERGKHKWKSDEDSTKTVECRWDWHQTGSHVVVTIYAKNYSPEFSTVQLNPIRLYANLIFPRQNDSTFTLDVELQRVIDVKASQASMFGTKVEITLKKAEPGSWSKLEVPQKSVKPPKPEKSKVDILMPQIESVDLSDL